MTYTEELIYTKIIKEWGHSDSDDLIKLEQLSSSAIDDLLSSLDIELKEASSPLENYKLRKIQFEWAEEVKQLCILLRNILFRKFRDLQLVQDHLMTIESFKDHRKSELEILSKAYQETMDSLQQIRSTEKIDEQLLEKWKNLNSPGHLLVDQIKSIKDQLPVFAKASSVLNVLRTEINENRADIRANFISLHSSSKSLKENIEQCYQLVFSIHKMENKSRLKVVKAELEKAYKKVESTRSDPPDFIFESSLRNSINIPVAIEAARLVIKEVNFSNQVNNYFESELYSGYLDEKNYIDREYDNALLVLFNTINRLSLYISEESDVGTIDINPLISPLSDLNEKLLATVKKTEEFTEKILCQLDNDLVASKIFDKTELFLPLEDSLSYLNLRTSRRFLNRLPLKRGRSVLKALFKSLLFKSSNGGNELSKTIEYIAAKKIKLSDEINNSLYLSKGYLGRSFYVNRPALEQKILDTYTYWKKGFGGSVLLYGNRLSGRTTMLNSLTDSISEVEIVSLNPNETIKYLGRKFDAGYNLKSALDFLNKYSISTKVIVIIDDLELWRSHEFSFYSNILALQESIGRNGKRLFFVVSTNNWMKMHLDNHVGFSDQFIVRLSTNQMSIEDIVKVIKIRHAANYHESNSEFESGDFDRVINQQARKIAIACNANIGATLNEWGRNTSLYHENFKSYVFEGMPEIVGKNLNQYRLILTHLFRYKQSSESELRFMIGDAFVREVTQKIQLLIGLGVLERKHNGIFLINDFLVSEIESLILEKHGKLSYKDE